MYKKEAHELVMSHRAFVGFLALWTILIEDFLAMWTLLSPTHVSLMGWAKLMTLSMSCCEPKYYSMG